MRSRRGSQRPSFGNSRVALYLLEKSVLGGSWVVINGVLSPLVGVITIVTLT